MNKPQAIAITPGEPAGIGPDIVIELAQEYHDQPLVILADEQLLRERAKILGLPLNIEILQSPSISEPAPAGTIYLRPVPLAFSTPPGQPHESNAKALLDALSYAAQGCIEGHYKAMVTGPINKAMINKAGISFTGHTEYIAGICHKDLPVMMLTSGDLRVALATTHLALNNVSQAITETLIERVLRILIQDLKYSFNIPEPRIQVLGLNPHAGENGFIGTEEIISISPAISSLAAQGHHVVGPVPADTAFLPARLQNFDAVLAMYHDQGLPVLKYAGFGQAVNCTLGLPVIRTSVDHGTALELAGTGQADSGSFKTALLTAQFMARNRTESGFSN